MTIKMALAITALGLVCTQASGQAIAPDLESLQGSWEGVLVGQEAAGTVSITIKGDSLHFRGLNPGDWYETTFTLPTGTYPQQLHATIKDCTDPCDDVGKKVLAIVKVEYGMLTLVGIQATGKEPPTSFGEIPGIEDNRIFRYKLQKAKPSLLRE